MRWIFRITAIAVIAILAIGVISRNPAMFSEMMRALDGKDAVFDTSFWKVPDTPATQKDGTANECRSRITLKPGHDDLTVILGWSANQLIKAGWVWKGSISGSNGMRYYDFYGIDQSYCNPPSGTSPAINPVPAVDPSLEQANNPTQGLVSTTIPVNARQAATTSNNLLLVVVVLAFVILVFGAPRLAHAHH